MQTIHLTQNNFKLFPTVYMVQNDTGRELKMILDDVTLDGTETGSVAIRRSDGSYYTISATLVAADNAFTAEMDQALTQHGTTECQLKVTDSNDDIVSSYTFHVMVQPSTDGVPQEQLGYSVQDLMDAANVIVHSDGLTPEIKNAILDCFKKVVWVDASGKDSYEALEAAFYPPADLVSISAVYTQDWPVYTTSSLDDLRADLVVTATYDDSTTETVNGYTLTGVLTAGTSEITVSYGGKTTTFNVTVTYDDYDVNLIDSLTWNVNKNYKSSTGVMQNASNEHCSDKFTVPSDMIYQFSSNYQFICLFVWDSNDNYLGLRVQNPANFVYRYMLRPGYKYALKINASGISSVSDFDFSNTSFAPVDNRATAVPRFEIVLSDYLDSIVADTNYYKLDISSIFAAAGITSGNFATAINKVSNVMQINYGTYDVTSACPFSLPFRIGFNNVSTLSFMATGISAGDLDAMKNYIMTNDVRIRFNY